MPATGRCAKRAQAGTATCAKARRWEGLLHDPGLEIKYWGFPGGAVVKNPPANAGDTGRALVREDPTCRGAAKPVHRNY